MQLGDGTGTFFWHDSWILERPLFDRFSSREIASLGFSEMDKVEEFIENGYVQWPPVVIDKWPELRNIYVGINANRPDKVSWVSRDGKLGIFKSSDTWNDFREVSPAVSWYHLVWFSNSIPKHSFILWLAIRNKLMTQVRMQMWQTEGIVVCPFCKEQRDSVEHLFFSCGFCREVLRFFSRKGVHIPEGLSWDQVVQFAANCWKGKSIVAIVNKLVLGSLIYFIWQERNMRLFQSLSRSSIQISALVEEAVRFKMLTLKVKCNSRVLKVLETWNVTTQLNSTSNGS